MSTHTVHLFSETPIPELVQVGGKALSLSRMTQAGLPVPPGFTCSVNFFKPWLDVMMASEEWAATKSAIQNGMALHDPTEALKGICSSLPLTDDQSNQLETALREFPVDCLFAVRSSSPEEDLAGASFAGVYETYLGVNRSTLHKALQDAFSSAFDERVFVYKQQHGFALDAPRIAVAVQMQIASEMAGVGFSLNPFNNDYDEAVINANVGLGESVVSGMVTPDQFVVNRYSSEIVERQKGSKQLGVYLKPDGGVEERPNPNAADYCLSDDQVLAITEMLGKIEAYYEMPMDIEWAYSEGELYLLQARPITSQIPLPPEMLTEPGARRRLYFDFGLVDVMTINQPMTPLTIDWMFGSLGQWLTPYIGPVELRADGAPAESFAFGAGGRPFINFSQVLKLVDVRRFSGSGGTTSMMDDITARLFANIDVDRYKAESKIPGLRWGSLLLHVPRSMISMGRFGLKVLAATRNPEKFRGHYDTDIAKAIRDIKNSNYEHLSLRKMIAQMDKDQTPIIGGVAAPPGQAYLMAVGKFMKLLNKVVDTTSVEGRQMVQALTTGFEGNEAANIGIQLYRMSKMLSPDDMGDLDALAARIKSRKLPDNFMSAWDAFIDEFGARGPSELELSNPRYGDEPRLALEQMSYMANSSTNPEAMQNRNVAARKLAYEKLLQMTSGRTRRKIEKSYKLMDIYGPARDTPKYLWVLNNYAVRRRALSEGKNYVEVGRLDSAEDIFWLTLDEIDSADADPELDMRALRDAKQPYYQKLNHVVTFPHLIDSRGRIGQVKRPEGDPNTLVGTGISSGKAKGRVKVLLKPREKPVEKGDILVTFTTDPGWTPLFVNAEAVVLEIGGMLQHGGVVAREYGKPCVVGIQGVTRELKDGQLVEVDGTSGTVKLLEG